MLKIGQIVDGKYKVLNKIGQGGMSIVYLAMNEKANKQWAIKEVRKDGKSDFEVIRQGLIAETDLLKKLKHPYLPSIIDVIDEKDTFLIVMDYIEGISLGRALKENGAQPQEDVISWAKQLCDVLTYLHSRQPSIIYRDMKPSNIMLKPDGNICLIDFGTAREYKKGNIEDTTVLGTKGYAAPEQYGGKGQTDARTDIYTLGATMYHLVTGHNPAKPPYEMKPIRKWNPNLSPGLEQIITKCTQADPNLRYQSAAELRYALEHYDELDVFRKIKQKKKLAAFSMVAGLSLVSLGACIFCRVKEEKAKSNSYESYINKAQDQAALGRYSDAYDNYMEAITIDASRGDAYNGILKIYTDDRIFTADEAQKMLSILTRHDNSAANENQYYFRNKNREDYAQFCYELAFNYYLTYTAEDDLSDGKMPEGNPQMALRYFQLVSEDYSDVASPIMKTCSTYLGNLARDSYNREKGDFPVLGGAGNTVDYKDTYQTMSKIITSDLGAEPSYRRLAVDTCYRIVCICGDWRVSFKNAGITEEELQKLVTDTKEYAENLVEQMDQDDEELLAELEIIKNQAGISREMITACYSMK